MTTLRKKIFYSKIQNIISQNDFILLFQFNNIKFKHWVLLKNQILNFQNTSILVIKNKIPYKIVFHRKTEIRFDSAADGCKFSLEINSNQKYNKHVNNLQNKTNENVSSHNVLPLNLKEKKKNLCFHFVDEKNILYAENNKKKLNFLCQGPTLMIAFNSVNQCKTIYKILNEFTYNFSSSKFQFKPKFLNLHKCKKSCFYDADLPLLFLKNKFNLDLQKIKFTNQENRKSSFFFIGGFIQGKAINHLDFEKLLQLNSSVYAKLIQQYSNPIVLMMFFNTVIKIKLLKCFQNNLINLLNIYKHNFKKISI